MSLPNLSNLSKLSLENAKCEPCGVTKQSFSFLLPGLTPAPGQAEPEFDEKDYICQICLVHLNYPSEGFIPSDGEIYDQQDQFDKNRNPTQEEKERYHDAASVAADNIRKSDPRRTQVELLIPGCGHQFHKLCLQKQVTGQSLLRNKCPISKTPIDPSILADLKGESASSLSSSSSAAPRGIVRERSAASTIPESDSDDDDESGPRARVRRVPMEDADWMRGEFARAFDQYFTDIRNASVQIQSTLDRDGPGFASDPYYALTQTALDVLRENARIYRERSPNSFANMGSLVQSEWDESIGNVVFAHILMEDVIESIDAASTTGQGEGRENYTSIAANLATLIQKLLPSAADNSIAHFELETTWQYQEEFNEDSSITVFDGRPNTEFQLHLYRYVILSQETRRDERMQPIVAFMTNLENNQIIPVQTKRTFLTLITMLRAAMNEAIVNDFTGELQRFYQNIVTHLNSLANPFGNQAVIDLREAFRMTARNAIEAIMQR